MDFWTEEQMRSIDKMLNPRSIAIVGASPKGGYGGRLFDAVAKAKDRVRIYSVNPNYAEIKGLKSYPSVSELPEAPRSGRRRRPVQQGARRAAGKPPQGCGRCGRDLRRIPRTRRRFTPRAAADSGHLRTRVGTAHRRSQLPRTRERQERHLADRLLSKVDRSAAYMGRYVAKNIVADGLATSAEIQFAYAIGYPDPVSVCVNTFGTAQAGLTDEAIEKAVCAVFSFKPADIIRQLNLLRPIYSKTTNYGHFGKNDPDITWERTDRTAALRRAVR